MALKKYEFRMTIIARDYAEAQYVADEAAETAALSCIGVLAAVLDAKGEPVTDSDRAQVGYEGED